MGATRGAALVTAASWLARGAALATLAVLARLLDPADFGVVAFAASIVLAAELLVRGGLAHALVQREGLDEEHTHAAFWASSAMACLLAGVLVVASPLVTAGLDDPDADAVLRAMALRLLLSALGEVPRALLLRARAFDVIALRSVAGAAAGVVVALAAGVAGLGVWALVLQVLVQAGVETATLWLRVPWRPEMVWSPRHATEVLRFGSGVVGMQAADLVARRSDVVVVGSVLGAAVAGVYAVGQRLVLLGVDLVVRAPLQVLLPTLARRQHDAERLRTGLLDAVRLTTAATVPVFGLLGVRSDDVIMLVFGPDWTAASPVLTALAAYGVVAGFAIVTNNVVLATGRSATAARLAMLEAVASVAALLLAVRHGATATALAFVAASVLALPVRIVATSRPLGLRTADVARAAGPGVLAGGLGVACGHVVGTLVAGRLGTLLVAGATTAAVHVLVLWGIGRWDGDDTLQRLAALVRSVRAGTATRPG